jgi:hypothetical protein
MRDGHPQSLPFITLRALSKGAPFPPGSPNRATIEGDAPLPEPRFNHVSEFLVNRPPMILDRAPVEKGACLQNLHKALVDELPTKFPSGAPTESDIRPLSPPPHVLLDPQKGAPLTGLPQREKLPFSGPPSICKNSQSTDFPGSPAGPYGERHPSPELSSTPFPQKSTVNEPPPHVPQKGPYGERSFISRANGLFIYLYLSRVPNKEPSHKNWGKHLATVRGAPHGRKAFIQWGAAWFPKGIIYDTAVSTSVPCSLQHNTFHCGLGRQEPR